MGNEKVNDWKSQDFLSEIQVRPTTRATKGLNEWAIQYDIGLADGNRRVIWFYCQQFTPERRIGFPHCGGLDGRKYIERRLLFPPRGGAQRRNENCGEQRFYIHDQLFVENCQCNLVESGRYVQLPREVLNHLPK